MSSPKPTIVCSSVDAASMNIMSHILEMDDWEKQPFESLYEDITNIYESGMFLLVEVSIHHIFQDGLDDKLSQLGFIPSCFIFASKHKSDDGRRLLTAHFTGNPSEAKFGGYPGKLSIAYSAALKPLLMQMQSLSAGMDYDVSMESTHHGPTDLQIPSIYAEIGSGPAQWDDKEAAEVLARSILTFNARELPVALGFGGGHYAARQSEIVFNNNVTFGHNIPSYQLEFVDESFFTRAVDKSGADFVYMDRKAISSSDKEHLSNLARQNGLLVLRESDIQQIGNIPWAVFKKTLIRSRYIEPTTPPLFTDVLRKDLEYSSPDVIPEPVELVIDERLVHYAWKSNPEHFLDMLQEYPLVYLQRDNGTYRGSFLLFEKKDAEDLQTQIIDECIKILKEHYEIEYIREDNLLYLTYRKFNPIKAESIGVPGGPLFGKLARGVPVEVDGNIIHPDMVHDTITKDLVLKNMIR
jgi:D-aminoacyl-tRNA deacylase